MLIQVDVGEHSWRGARLRSTLVIHFTSLPQLRGPSRAAVHQHSLCFCDKQHILKAFMWLLLNLVILHVVDVESRSNSVVYSCSETCKPRATCECCEFCGNDSDNSHDTRTLCSLVLICLLVDDLCLQQCQQDVNKCRYS